MKVDPERIRRWRDERAWSQEQLAAVSGLSLRTVQRVEAVGTASADTRMALATALGVDLRELGAPAAAEPSAGDAPAIAEPEPVPATVRWSHRSYRLLRLAVVVGLLVAMDVSESGRLTWSRWALAFALAFVVLRLFRHRFVDADEGRRRARIFRGERSS